MLKNNPKKKEVEIFSVALAKPSEDNMSKIPTLDFFCPTWDILKAYKRTKDWDVYMVAYRNILIKNKKNIMKWINSLNPLTVYVLCCWENTNKGANCHRQLIFSALTGSKKTKEKINCVYRHGEKSQYNFEKQVLSTIPYLGNRLEQQNGWEIPGQMSNQEKIQTVNYLLRTIGVPNITIHDLNDNFDNMLNFR